MAEQQVLNPEVLGQAIVNAFREVQKPEKSDYELLNKSVFNPSGKPRAENLKYELFLQNGYRVNPEFLTDEEIKLANRLKPGRYNERRWEVVIREEGGHQSLELRYPNKSQEDRFRLMAEAPTLSVMLKKIIAEQEANAKRG